MFTRAKNGSSITVDFEGGYIDSIKLWDIEIIGGRAPLFTVGIRDEKGVLSTLSSFDCKKCGVSLDGDKAHAVYSGFDKDIQVLLSLGGDCLAEWHVEVKNNTDKLIEWIKVPDIQVKPLKKNGGNGSILCTYNEGAICDDIEQKQKSWFLHREQEYPSYGSNRTFPNMVASRFQCYMTDGYGLYTGVHDKNRAVKGIGFYPEGENVIMQFKLFTGVDFGEDFICDHPIIFDTFKGGWEKGADFCKSYGL